MFWGTGLFVLPLMLLYTAISYHVFRGRVDPSLTVLATAFSVAVETTGGGYRCWHRHEPGVNPHDKPGTHSNDFRICPIGCP